MDLPSKILWPLLPDLGVPPASTSQVDWGPFAQHQGICHDACPCCTCHSTLHSFWYFGLAGAQLKDMVFCSFCAMLVGVFPTVDGQIFSTSQYQGMCHQRLATQPPYGQRHDPPTPYFNVGMKCHSPPRCHASRRRWQETLK